MSLKKKAKSNRPGVGFSLFFQRVLCFLTQRDEEEGVCHCVQVRGRDCPVSWTGPRDERRCEWPTAWVQSTKKKEKITLPMEAQTKIQNRMMVLKHGGAPLVTDESGLCRRGD